MLSRLPLKRAESTEDRSVRVCFSASPFKPNMHTIFYVILELIQKVIHYYLAKDKNLTENGACPIFGKTFCFLYPSLTKKSYQKFNPAKSYQKVLQKNLTRQSLTKKFY